LKSRQQPNGEWLQEAIEGVFNKSWYVIAPAGLTRLRETDQDQHDFISKL
jgi:squalene cyclase